MFHLNIRRTLLLVCLLLLFWLQLFSSQFFSALAIPLSSNLSQSVSKTISPTPNDWNELDQKIAEAVKKVRPIIDNFAARELDYWVNERMKQVDEQFLNWYFSFVHQKATQDAVPFAWLAFQVDFLNLLKAEDEKGLSPDQIIQKRMLDEFEQKFKELVMNEAALNNLNDRIVQIVLNYGTSLNFQFDLVKAKYHVSEQDWEQHMKQIAQLIYDTGTSESSLSPDSLTSLQTTKVITATSLALGTKLAVSFAPKLAVKTGSSLALSMGAKFVDPLLIVGLLVWDTADHQMMVDKSRPELRKNIEDYLKVVKLNIYDAPDGSIMSAIDEAENQIVDLLIGRC